MGFPRQEYWSGLPFLSSGDLSNPGIDPKSPALAGGFFTAEPPGHPLPSTLDTYCHLFMAEKTKAQTGCGLGRKDTTYPQETLIMVALYSSDAPSLWPLILPALPGCAFPGAVNSHPSYKLSTAVPSEGR